MPLTPCIYCKSKNIERYLGFSACKDCGRTFDLTDIGRKDLEEAYAID